MLKEAVRIDQNLHYVTDATEGESFRTPFRSDSSALNCVFRLVGDNSGTGVLLGSLVEDILVKCCLSRFKGGSFITKSTSASRFDSSAMAFCNSPRSWSSNFRLTFWHILQSKYFGLRGETIYNFKKRQENTEK